MPRFTPVRLREIAAEIISLAGSSDEEAWIVAGNLVDANLTGHDSHGVGMIPAYVNAIRHNGLKPNTPARLRDDRGPVLAFDGQRGYGQIVGRQAITKGIERARTCGICAVSLANSHHLGRIGAWAEQAAAAGLISIHFVNVCSKPRVVPWEGLWPRLGTNPFCVGIPRAGQPPLITDFATSIIASGKARLAYLQGVLLEPGQALDHLGNPTTDPGTLVKPPLGALRPFGQHKGSGLSIVCALLGAALTGSPTERHARPDNTAIVNGMLSILLDPHAFGGLATFQTEVEEFLAWVRTSREDEALSLPGEPEHAQRARRSEQGIDIDTATWESLTVTRNSFFSVSTQ